MNKTLKINKRKHVSLDARKARAGYLFVAPFILGLILIYIPILLDSIWYSFNDIRSEVDPETGEAILVLYNQGFKYYVDAFVSGDFVEMLLAGLQQLVTEVPAVIIFSLFIAVVLNGKMLGRAVFRAIFFVPVIISTGLMEVGGEDAAVSEMENGIDDGSGGGLVSTLALEELFKSMAIGGDFVQIIVDLVNKIYQIINYSGVQMLIFLAGLQSISESIYEACRIDGATGWETFWKVTFPMISPMILVNAVYSIIDAFTRGSNKTMSYITESVLEINQSQATAMYWIYFIVVLLIIAAIAGIISTFIFYQRKD